MLNLSFRFFILLILSVGLLSACDNSSTSATTTETSNSTPSETTTTVNNHPLLSHFSKQKGNANFKTCGYDTENKGKVIPADIAKKYDLYHLNIDLAWEKKYNANSPMIVIKGLNHWMHKGRDILLYTVKLGTDETEFGAMDVRVLVLDADKDIVENQFLAGYAAEEGENIVCRVLQFTDTGLELLIDDESENIPSHLQLKENETITF